MERSRSVTFEDYYREKILPLQSKGKIVSEEVVDTVKRHWTDNKWNSKSFSSREGD